MTQKDLLIELHTEELPPKVLLKLAQAFSTQVKEQLEKAQLKFSDVHSFATPRRLAVFVQSLAAAQDDQTVERKGPALAAAFDAEGKPTKACEGFARSFNVAPDALQVIKTAQGEWVGFSQHVPGKTVQELLPAIVSQVASTLPIPKRMRWGMSEAQFVRPVHSVILLYGDEIIEANILGCQTNRVTRGHRFHAPDWMTIPDAATYSSLLKTEGQVIADFAERRDLIRQLAIEAVQKKLDREARLLITSEALLNEVTGLVEWPVALCGTFDAEFLNLPNEVLISAMQDHQRYFPVVDLKGKLMPYFVTISNIQSHDPARVIHGNERVLRARLSDAAFFYATDKKESLEQRVERLRGIVFHAKLGSLYDKAERVSKVAEYIAAKIGAPEADAKRAGLLAKADLTTDMVGEFPELQGIMGGYYARHDQEAEEVALAIAEQYHPRFAGDTLPRSLNGQVLALADRIDTLVGTFGINQIPTGDKDPYGLRRAAIGILRILIEEQMDLDLKDVFQFAQSGYQVQLENNATVMQLLEFMSERLRAWYQEQSISADVFAAVSATGMTNPFDFHKRIHAVQAFKQLNEAETLCIANKRVSNILAQYAEPLESQDIHPEYFSHAAEQELARELDAKSNLVMGLYQSGKYDEVLVKLAELRQPIDNFFDQVMVMTEEKKQRENRILLLTKLRALFLQVADVALLQ